MIFPIILLLHILLIGYISYKKPEFMYEVYFKDKEDCKTNFNHPYIDLAEHLERERNKYKEGK